MATGSREKDLLVLLYFWSKLVCWSKLGQMVVEHKNTSIPQIYNKKNIYGWTSKKDEGGFLFFSLIGPKQIEKFNFHVFYVGRLGLFLQ
jgi:hypothetical protein